MILRRLGPRPVRTHEEHERWRIGYGQARAHALLAEAASSVPLARWCDARAGRFDAMAEGCRRKAAAEPDGSKARGIMHVASGYQRDANDAAHEGEGYWLEAVERLLCALHVWPLADSLSLDRETVGRQLAELGDDWRPKRPIDAGPAR